MDLLPGIDASAIVLPDVALAVAAAACMALLCSLVTSTLALRRSRTLARSSEALMAELAVFKDAAVTLGQHVDRRGVALRTEAQPASASATERRAPAASERRVTATNGGSPPPVLAQAAEAPLSALGPILPDTQRAFDLARQGASIDDLVAACDVSRTEAGLMLAMSRRGRRVLGA
jgi:hypothetical protein